MSIELCFVCDENGYGMLTYELKDNLVILYHPVYGATEWYYQVYTEHVVFTSPDGGDVVTAEAGDVNTAVAKQWGGWDYNHPAVADEIVAISDLQPLKSAAGYYVGRLCLCDDEQGGTYPCPYDRISSYYKTWDAAAKAAQAMYVES